MAAKVTPNTEPESGTPSFAVFSEAELDALIERVEAAKVHNLALSAADYQLLLDVVLTLANMQERLSHNDLTIAKLRKLLGMVRSSEKLKDLQGKGGVGGTGTDAGATGNGTDASGSDTDTSGDTGNGTGETGQGSGPKDSRKSNRKPKSKPSRPEPTVEHHGFEDMGKGDVCPACNTGKLYKYQPAQFVRITGHSPYSIERHVREQLRCNACGQIFTAPVPADVQADGEPGHPYGYSARSLMGIHKCLAGNPYCRQQSLQQLLAMSISASTIFDQCEALADALHPVFKQLKRDAANAQLYYIDDTSHRILQQEPVKKIRKGRERWRTGVYASGLLAIVQDPDPPAGGQPPAERRLVLYQTNVGHAGEWLDEILRPRSLGLPAPIVMSDALSSNQITEAAVINVLCNVHGRRGFVEQAEHYPAEIEQALRLYQVAWVNDTHCEQHRYSPEQRRDYHREHSLPAMQSLRQWCEQSLETDGTIEPNSNLGKAMQYFVNHFTGLSQFCQTPGAPIDNNEIERLLKVIVRDRKAASFHQTANGAAISNVITSVLVTCQENEVNGFDYLNTIQRNQASVTANPTQWMPWNYRDDLASKTPTDSVQTVCQA